MCCALSVAVCVNLLVKFVMMASLAPPRKKKAKHPAAPAASSAAPARVSGAGGEDALQGDNHSAAGDDSGAGGEQQRAAHPNDAVPQQGGGPAASGALSADMQRQWFEDRLAVERADMTREQFVRSVTHAFQVMIPPTGARRAQCVVGEDALTPFSSATADARKSAFASFLVQCPTANFSDFLEEIRSDANPNFDWDCSSDSESDGDGADGGADDHDGDNEELPSSKRPRLSSSSSTFTGPSSSAASAAVSSSVACKFTFDDYVRMSRTPDDMLQPCVEATCSVRRKDHEKQVSESSFKMPPREAFPTFRDPKDKLMDDPFEFLAKLERQLKLYRVPRDRYGVILVSCLRDRLMQEWVETNIVATCHTWEDMKTRFKEKYDDPEIKNRLMLQLEKCVQSFDERVYEYTERYQSLVVRISAGAPIDTQMNIIMCERGFIPELRSELAKYRSMKTQSLGRTFEFNSLGELYQAAATLECGLAPRAGRIKSATGDARARKRTRRARLNNVEVASKPKPVSVLAPSVNKIEMMNGKPVNVNKKHRQRKSTGGGSVKGGRPGGSKPPGSTGSAASGASAGPARNTGASSGGAAGAAKPFTGTCFKCGKTGHRIADCRSQ